MTAVARWVHRHAVGLMLACCGLSLAGLFAAATYMAWFSLDHRWGFAALMTFGAFGHASNLRWTYSWLAEREVPVRSFLRSFVLAFVAGFVVTFTVIKLIAAVTS